MHFAVLNIVQNFTYDHTRQVVLKRYAVHVRWMFTLSHMYVVHVLRIGICRTCTTYMYAVHVYTIILYGVHARRTCTPYMYDSVNIHRTCTAYMCDVSNMLKRTYMYVVHVW